METSLGRLQKQVDTLSKQIVRLQDNLAIQKDEKRKAKYELKKLKEQIDFSNLDSWFAGIPNGSIGRCGGRRSNCDLGYQLEPTTTPRSITIFRNQAKCTNYRC